MPRKWPRRAARGLPALSLFAALLLPGLSLPAQALFLKTQMERIDPEPLFDSEYFADLLSFSFPEEWNDLWKGSTIAYRVNAASLDCCDLLLHQELKFRYRLMEGFNFKFRLLQRDDKDFQELHHFLEFEKILGKGFWVEMFGEPSFRKEDADIGLGLSWRRGRLKIGARRTLVDFNFNQRGSTGQRYGRKPLTDEFSLEAGLGDHAVSVELELDYPLRRQVPAENRLFSYRRTTAQASWRHSPPGGWTKLIEYDYQFQAKGNGFAPDPALASLDSRRQAHHGRAATWGELGSRDRLEAGQAFVLRAARADSPANPAAGAFYRRWEAQPYLRWRRRFLKGGPPVTERGYQGCITELAGFLSVGENRRRYPGGSQADAYDGVAEAKLGGGIDFLFFPSGRIGLYTTFDLDALGRHFWDGGNLRALFVF